MVKIRDLLNYHKHLYLAIAIYLAIFIVGPLIFAQARGVAIIWGLRTAMKNERSYPSIYVGGEAFGNLTVDEANAKLDALGTQSSRQGIKLTRGGNSWSYTGVDLGLDFDRAATLSKIFSYNRLAGRDELKFLTNQKNQKLDIEPAFSINDERCTNALGNILVNPTAPADATFSFDGQVNVVPETLGSKFEPLINCEAILASLRRGENERPVYLTPVIPAVRTAALTQILPPAQHIVSTDIKLNTKSAQVVVTRAELFTLLKVAVAPDGKASLGFDPAKLDNELAKIAAQTDSDNPAPAVSSCEYVVRLNGYRLDREDTKKIFTEQLTASDTREFTLKVDHSDPQIARLVNLNTGKSGTAYLTYDDGLTYGGQIMDTAACFGVHITFFEVGSRANQDAPLLKRAIAEGHAVQSHAYFHYATNYGTGHDYNWQYGDIKASIDIITSITGVRPTYFRPPGGNKTSDTYAAAAANNVKLILWTLSSSDTSSQIVTDNECRIVTDSIKDGSVVLMHSTLKKTADAAACIMRGTAAKGLRMEALR